MGKRQIWKLGGPHAQPHPWHPMPLPRDLQAETDGRTDTPRSLTIPRHQVAEEQGQGQRHRQQLHPCHLPRPVTGWFFYNQPPPGISQAGKRHGVGKKAALLFDFPCVASPHCMWPPPKKAQTAVVAS